MAVLTTRIALVIIGIALGIGVVSSYITITEMERKIDYVYDTLQQFNIEYK